jgi:hypothetical protein
MTFMTGPGDTIAAKCKTRERRTKQKLSFVTIIRIEQDQFPISTLKELAFQENTEKSKSKADRAPGQADISSHERNKEENARLLVVVIVIVAFSSRLDLVHMPVQGLVSSFPRQHRQSKEISDRRITGRTNERKAKGFQQMQRDDLV